MKYRLLFIGLVAVLFASLTVNVIHSESLDAAKEAIKVTDMVQSRLITILHDRIYELEN